MRIVVVCGAGASSTFAALRIRRAAEARGLDVDAVLVGTHLAERRSSLAAAAAAASVPLAMLPGETRTLDGDAALDLAIAITGARS
jgi:PTS system cellobiose-specific IIB component